MTFLYDRPATACHAAARRSVCWLEPTVPAVLPVTVPAPLCAAVVNSQELDGQKERSPGQGLFF